MSYFFILLFINSLPKVRFISWFMSLFDHIQKILLALNEDRICDGNADVAYRLHILLTITSLLPAVKYSHGIARARLANERKLVQIERLHKFETMQLKIIQHKNDNQNSSNFLAIHRKCYTALYSLVLLLSVPLFFLYQLYSRTIRWNAL